MTINVSSDAVDELRSKSATITRTVTIAGSDYSDRVTKWPKLSWDYDEIRPKSVKLAMANADDAFGFFRADKTTMRSVVEVGATIRTIQREPFSLASMIQTDVFSLQNTNIVGTFQTAQNGAFFISCHTEPGSASLKKWQTVAPYQVNSMSVADTYNLQAIGLTSPAGVSYTNSGDFYVVGENPDCLVHLQTTGINIGSLTFVSCIGLTFDASGIEVNSDASLIMIGDTANNTINTFVLTSPGSISTASLTSVYSLSVNSFTLESGFCINNEWSELYAVNAFDGQNAYINRFTMAIPGSLETGSMTLDSFAFYPNDLQNIGGAFSVDKSNRNRMFIGDESAGFIALTNSQQGVFTKSISDVSSYAFTAEVFSSNPGASTDIAGTMHISSGGQYLFACISGPNEELKRYTMSPAYNVTSMTAGGAHSVLPDDSAMRGIHVMDDGTTIYTCGDQHDRLYKYAALTAFDVDTVTLVASLDLPIAGTVVPHGVFVVPDESKIFVGDRFKSNILEYSLTTPGSLSTLTIVNTFAGMGDVTSRGLTGFSFADSGHSLFAVGGDTLSTDILKQFYLPTAYTTAVYSEVGQVDITSGSSLYFAMGIPADARTNLYLAVSNGDRILRMTSPEPPPPGLTYSVDTIAMFAGEVASIDYNDELCTINVVDKFKQLSDRVIGTNDSPVSFTGSNYLGSDLAWWICTSYGGLDTTASSLNTDIDYGSFLQWAEVFSADQIRFRAEFDGQKCTEALRKIAKQASSSIYVQGGKLVFKRIGVAEIVVDSYGAGELTDVSLSFATEDIINRQLISGAYTPDSGHLFTITEANTTSVNSFGIRENLLKDSNVWFVESSTAINHAQRMLILSSNPDDEVRCQSSARGWIRSVGETITVVDSFHGLAENYLIRGVSFDLDDGSTDFALDKILLKQPFRLDVSTLNNTVEVLT